MKAPRVVSSYRELVALIATQMPDEYPEGMALTFADAWLKDGSFVIEGDTGDRSNHIEEARRAS